MLTSLWFGAGCGNPPTSLENPAEQIPGADELPNAVVLPTEEPADADGAEAHGDEGPAHPVKPSLDGDQPPPQGGVAPAKTPLDALTPNEQAKLGEDLRLELAQVSEIEDGLQRSYSIEVKLASDAEGTHREIAAELGLEANEDGAVFGQVVLNELRSTLQSDKVASVDQGWPAPDILYHIPIRPIPVFADDPTPSP